MEWARLRFLALFHDPGTSEHIGIPINYHCDPFDTTDWLLESFNSIAARAIERMTDF